MGVERDFEDYHYVLLVDDDNDLTRTTQQILEGEGYRVITACNPPEAFKVIFELERLGLTPSTVITDLNMPPHMNGFQFKEEFSSRYSEVEVLLMTTSPDERVREFKRNGGKVIDKPFDLDELCNQVAKSEGLFRRRKEIRLA